MPSSGALAPHKSRRGQALPPQSLLLIAVWDYLGLRACPCGEASITVPLCRGPLLSLGPHPQTPAGPPRLPREIAAPPLHQQEPHLLSLPVRVQNY